MATSETGQDRLGRLHVRSSSRGKSSWFPFSKTRNCKGCASAPRLLCVPKKEKGRFPVFQLLDPGASARVHGLPDAVARSSAKAFCKASLVFVRKGQKGQW